MILPLSVIIICVLILKLIIGLNVQIYINKFVVGIFFSKCRVGNLRDTDIDRRAPGMYFRMERDLRTRQDRLGVEIRERVKWDIREGVIGSDTFDPKHAIIVTWKNVSFNGGFGNALYKTNTFQMVLATDEVFTYAIFNYLTLDWTAHTEAGGDTITGNFLYQFDI